MDKQALKEQLHSEELEEGWTSIIDGVIDEESRREALLEWIKSHRDEFVELLEVVSDEEEIHKALLIKYVAAKSDWKLLNTHMQYKMVETGEQDPELMAKGSLISNLLETLEEFLEPSEIDQITDFLSRPINEISDQ
jgi:predicted kinase